MAVPSLPQLEGARATFREILSRKILGPADVQVENTDGRWIVISLTPDGISSWLMRVRADDGRVIFDCGGKGVVGVDEDSMLGVVRASFQALDLRPLS